MESLGYLFIYFLKGKLPWQSVKCTDKEQKYATIKKLKINISIEELCIGLPNEFQLYLQHIKSLEFTEKPNYNYLRSLFRDLFKQHKFVYDLVFDWSKLL